MNQELTKLLRNASPFDMVEHSICLCYRGSIAHGTFIPGSNPSGIDDKDILGIAIPPESYFFGLKVFEQFDIFEGEWDVLVYDLKKLVRLLTKSNPNVLQIMWTPKKYFLKQTQEFECLEENRSLFAHKGIYQAFCGYSYGQLKKMEACAYGGYMGEKRKALVDKFGYDCKNAQHLIRLLRQGTEFLRTGEIVVERPDADELMAIKSGEWSIERVKRTAEQLFKGMETAHSESTLPEHPDREAIDSLVQDILQTHFGTAELYRRALETDRTLLRTAVV